MNSTKTKKTTLKVSDDTLRDIHAFPDTDPLFPCLTGSITIPELFKKLPKCKPWLMDYNDMDLSILYDMKHETPGTVNYCLLEMKRYMVVEQAKKAYRTLRKEKTKTWNSNQCPKCMSIFHVSYRVSDYVCKTCGYAEYRLMEPRDDAMRKRQYSTTHNQNARHHYHSAEHFAQVVCDFTLSGNRTIPASILDCCRHLLGNGDHVTNFKVYKVLHDQGYRGHYNLKYAIAARLRFTPEFTVSNHETRMMKHTYRRLSRHIMDFQRKHNIGKRNANGKLRLYWPMRFVLARICELIKRPDLVQHIRGVVGKNREVLYQYYWDRLVEYVNKISGNRMDITDHSSAAVPLVRKRRRR